MTREERFWAKVEKTDSCWEWTGCVVAGSGYGQFCVGNGKRAYAHRYAYELLVGAIPEGLQIDHLCRVRHCVNPAHLEAVSPRENTLRSGAVTAANARKTHCKHGHPFTEENTYVRKHGRGCRECHRRAALKAYHQNKEAA